MRIEKAGYEDLKTILSLQYLAYQSEADLFGTRNIPPLKQTLDEVVSEYNNGAHADSFEVYGKKTGHLCKKSGCNQRRFLFEC